MPWVLVAAFRLAACPSAGPNTEGGPMLMLDCRTLLSAAAAALLVAAPAAANEPAAPQDEAQASLEVDGPAAPPPAAAAPEAPSGLPAEAAAPKEPAQPKLRFKVSLGFSHWFGQQFGEPFGMYTPMVMVGVRPNFEFVELRLRYTMTAVLVPVPGDTEHRVGFTNLEVVFTRSVKIGKERLEIYIGEFATLVNISTHSVGGGFGAVFGFEWTFLTHLPGNANLGLLFATRGSYFHLPGDNRDWLKFEMRKDAQMDLAFVATFG